jgi:hypothetical protein
MKYTSVAFVLATLFIAALTSNMARLGAEVPDTWDAKSAAAYLDARQAWWRNWPTAARDHDTACISCHSALPYAMARPALRSRLNESGPSANESKLLADVVKRPSSPKCSASNKRWIVEFCGWPWANSLPRRWRAVSLPGLAKELV